MFWREEYYKEEEEKGKEKGREGEGRREGWGGGGVRKRGEIKVNKIDYNKRLFV